MFILAQILVKDGFFERSSLIGLTHKEKCRVSYSVGIKDIVSNHLRYCK